MKLAEILHLEETTSTNSFLKEWQQEQPLLDGFTVYADYQTAGRGQRVNHWESAPKENLLFSTILYPKQLRASGQFIISQIISLAVKDVLSQEIGAFSIKWPNDIYWQEKKIAGILIENDIMDGEIFQSVIGVGINLNQTSFASDSPNPVSLKQITGKEYDVKKILDQIIERLFHYYALIQTQEGILEVRMLYAESLFRKEGLHQFMTGGRNFCAGIESIEESGLLVLKTEEGELRKFAFKEIQYIL